MNKKLKEIMFIFLKVIEIIFCSINQLIILVSKKEAVYLVGLIGTGVGVYLSYLSLIMTVKIQKTLLSPLEIQAYNELKIALTGNEECVVNDPADISGNKRHISIREFRLHRHVIPFSWDTFNMFDKCSATLF